MFTAGDKASIIRMKIMYNLDIYIETFHTFEIKYLMNTNNVRN